MHEIDSLLAPAIAAVEAEMQRHIPPAEGRYRPFYGMLHYHLGWANESFTAEAGPRGKRIRSALCLLSCAALAGDFRAALPAAASVELLHEFSLIHDDIEDGDEARRHRPTLWVRWGMPQALNVGDGLFAIAQLALLGLAERDVPPATVVRAQRAFNETAVRLCQGQFLDISFEQQPCVAPDDYIEMISGKTAALVRLAAWLGGLVGGGDEAALVALANFGEAIGLAFQMQDDLLGLWGDAVQTGKPVGNDIVRRKKSLPVLLALSSETEAGRALRDLYARPALTSDDIAPALQLIEATGARAAIQQRLRAEHDRAFAALDTLPDDGSASLRHLADALLDRTY